MQLSETEKFNQNTKNIDTLTTFEKLKLINEEDKKVALAVEKALPEIAEAVDIITKNFQNGGRLLYFGAGTSGRLGVLDASECPPTFSTNAELVVGTIAGGDSALRNAIEGAEDSEELAVADFEKLNITVKDTVVTISANGNAKYNLKISELAKNAGAKNITITSNQNAQSRKNADVFICVETGSEVISGSTRMKAGTAQKMVLNMLTTAAMINLGKVFDNMMIDVKPTNEKLKQRAARIVAAICDVEYSKAQKTLQENGHKIKNAVLKIKANLNSNEAEKLLQKNQNNLKLALKELGL